MGHNDNCNEEKHYSRLWELLTQFAVYLSVYLRHFLLGL